MSEKQKNIVLLIDADNAPLRRLEQLIDKLALNGRIIVKRAYGNWKKEQLKNWEDELRRLAIKPMQQFDYVAHKNATDMALVIDAMDLMYDSIDYDIFAIVSSDSDYTPLAIKLRERGISVIGVGERKTPTPFRNACDEFLDIETLNADKAEAAPIRQSKPSAPRQLDRLDILLKNACDQFGDEDGFAFLSQAGHYIKRAWPDFDIRYYGYPKLRGYIENNQNKYEYNTEGAGTAVIVRYRCIF